ncbi:MAG TPA: translation initiation factor IF-2 N-terminal domain-containing protein, partial [Candidatus Andersenbacteria bacterium]|nr:translation initiation factor IF-2 N-terminal domain-containing protein [Candidatus Andersenbacteria bacterium]
MAPRVKAKRVMKIADVLAELKLSEGKLYHILREVNIRTAEGQKNLDQQEVARVRQYLNEQRRREELKQKSIKLPPIIKVQQLAKALEIPVGEVLSTLLGSGVLATLNDDVDYETAAIIAADLGYNTEEEVEQLEQDVLTPEKLDEILKKENPKEQTARPPVVTIMGHIDHGKTTLLDAIRSTNVAAGEAGGITQAISSYQVEKAGRTITFIDTPGHATFEFMRKRGVSLADIAVLVVAADDGVKPQTKEAIKHAQAAGVPIVVALNKMDKATANIERVKKELAELDLLAEDWGGTTVVVPVSALKKEGVDALLEMILLTADIDAPRAISGRPALGSVIESRLDKHL